MTNDVKQKLKAHGATDAHLEQLDALPAEVRAKLNWPAIIAVLAADGPKFITDLVAAFAAG